MTKDDFRERLADLQISIKEFSSICGIGYSTAKDWKTIPKWVPLVLSQIKIMKQMKIDYEDIELLNKKIYAFDEISKITKEI